MRYTPIHIGIVTAWALAGCCGDQPDLCGQGELIVDAGLSAAPCWTAERAPLRTEATAAEPGVLGVLGCVQLADGWCVQGAAGLSWGQYDRRHHAPAGAWVTTARGFGCPDAECAMDVGRAEGHIGPRAEGIVNRPAPIEYDLRCDPPPGRPPLPAVREPRTGDLRPAWMVECLAGLPFWTEPMANGRWRIHDVDAEQNVVEHGRVRGWNGVERASVVGWFMGCTQRRCAALNTWSEPARDLDRDGVQARCDVCPAVSDPGQADRDGDGAGDVCDVCPAAFDPWQTDGDVDGVGDVCDVCPAVADGAQRDGDGDGRGDACDVCPTRFDPAQVDGDGDGFGDVCDVCPDVADVDQADGDGDGVGDACDNCPALADVMQVDTDADGDGDLCDEDDDDDGLSDQAEAEVETDPLNPDTDDDGHLDGADNCPNDANPLQADADEDGIGDACADRDDDGVLDGDDNCVAVGNPEQVDTDEDGIGDACCGDDDPDDDDVPNCWLYPEADPRHGQRGALTGWDSEWPGVVSCADGARRCRPAMEAPPMTRPDLEQFFARALGGELQRPAGWPPEQDWPPVSVLSAEQHALYLCYAEFSRRQGAVLPFDPDDDGPFRPGVDDAEMPEFSAEDYADCVQAQLAAMQPVAVQQGRNARFGVGLVFEKVLYLTLFAPMNLRDDVRCSANRWFRKEVMTPPPGGGPAKRRTVEADIICEHEDGFTQWVEAKAWKTSGYLRPSRRVTLNDQLRRQWKWLEQKVTARGDKFRWTWIWAWKPPRHARLIMDHRWAGRRDPMVFDYHPLRRYSIDRIDTRIEPAHGWYIWTNPSAGGGIIDTLLRGANEPILDEGPCSVCNISDIGQPYWSPACDLSAVNLPEVVDDGEPGVQPIEYNRGSPYLDATRLRRSLDRYVDLCILSPAECPEGWDLFADLLACGLER